MSVRAPRAIDATLPDRPAQSTAGPLQGATPALISCRCEHAPSLEHAARHTHGRSRRVSAIASPTFAGFAACDGPESASAAIAIVGAEHATPYRAGEPSHCVGAPAALRAALKGYAREPGQYDFDLGGVRPVDVVDTGDLPGDPAQPDRNRERIRGAVRTLLERNAAPVVLGGDDSVPIPVLQAFEGRGPVTLVQVDAHLDWRDEVHGERWGWSSPMRRASEMPWIERIVQVGLRGVGSAREREVADARAWGVHIVPAADVHRHGIGPVLELVPDGSRCFVTLDCDGIDPSIMPAVLAPVPGGLMYWHVHELLHGLAAKTRLVGFDLVEFVPARDPQGLAALTAARITCNAIGAIATSARTTRR
jgi:agmatinase